MKLVRYGAQGAESPGIVDSNGRIRELRAYIDDWTGNNLGADSLARISELQPEALPLVDNNERLGPPVANVGKVVCVGLNYSDHAAEAGFEVPDEPVLFMKATSAICGPYDEVQIPPGSETTDWEVELAIIIGTRATRITSDTALECVAGYCLVNDLTERSWQMERSGQWVKGKSADTFAPLGPWLVTTDELKDPANIALGLDVNNEPQQSGNTSNMIVDAAGLVSYISGFMTLLPGDVICTGTPPGVGFGQKPQRFLKPGDTIRAWDDRLGEQRQTVAG